MFAETLTGASDGQYWVKFQLRSVGYEARVAFFQRALCLIDMLMSFSALACAVNVDNM
jgi:hypothetical protein